MNFHRLFWIAPVTAMLALIGCQSDSSSGRTSVTSVNVGSGSNPGGGTGPLPSAMPLADLVVTADFNGTWPPAPVATPVTKCAGRVIGSGRSIDVGPGNEHTELNTVPWRSLTAGDVVNIH